MRPRIAIAAALFTALATFGLSLARSHLGAPARGARVWGGPWQGQRTLSVRIATVEQRGGADTAWAAGDIEVEIGTISARAALGAPGLYDANIALDHPLDRGERVIVRSSRAGVIADGPLEPVHGGWGPLRRGGPLPAQGQGPLSVSAIAGRGVIAPPFPEFLIVRVASGKDPASGAVVRVETDGATAQMAESGLVNSLGNASGTVSATTREAAIRLTAQSPQGLGGTLVVPLPTITGAMWLDPDGLSEKPPRIRIVSPVPRSLAYVTIADDTARLWGGTIPLAPGEKAASEGSVPWPVARSSDVPAHTVRQAWITVSPDVFAASAMSVGWPILLGDGLAPVRPSDALEERRFADFLLLDGVPATEHREARTRAAARVIGMVGVGSGLVLAALIAIEQALPAMRKRPRGWPRTAAIYGAAACLAIALLSVAAMWIVA
jgi:hypothetical protein